MPLRIRCPEGCSFNAPVMQAGRQVRCPVCRAVIQIPHFDAAASTQVLLATLAEVPAESSETRIEADSQSQPLTTDSSNSVPSESIAALESKIESAAQDASYPSLHPETLESEPTVLPSDTTPLGGLEVEAPEPIQAGTEIDSLAFPITEPSIVVDPAPPSSPSPEPPRLRQEDSGLVHQVEGSIRDQAISELQSESASNAVPSTLVALSSVTPAPTESAPITNAASPEIELTDEAPADPASANEVTSDLTPAFDKPVSSEAIPSPSFQDPVTRDSSPRDPESDSSLDQSKGSAGEAPLPSAAESLQASEVEAIPGFIPESSPTGESSAILASESTETTPYENARPALGRPSETPDPASADTIVGVIPLSDTPSVAEEVSSPVSFPAIVTAAATAVPTLQLDHSRLAVFEVRRHQAAFETTRRTVSRIIAFLILCLGLANIAIGLFQSGWLVNPASSELRTWAIVLILIGGLHGAYAALLAQVSDWSAHWVSATFLLLMALGSAAAAVVLGLARPDHGLIRWLELPTLLQVQGAIWALCMVLMSSALAWWCGREAISWRTVVSQLRQRETANQDAQAT